MKNIHILPTYKPSRLRYWCGDLKLNSLSLAKKLDDGVEFQNIYITSDEEIKKGDWYYIPNQMIGFEYISKEWNKSLGSIHAEKIILTTDQDLIKDGVQAIDDDFLQWFVKNQSCESVEVIPLRKSSGHYDEKEIWNWDFLAYKIIIPDHKHEKITDVDVAIMLEEIKKEERNKELTEVEFEEAAESWINRQIEIILGETTHSPNLVEAFVAGIKWYIDQGNSKYTIEDITNALHSVELADNKDYTWIFTGMKEWLENAKKQ